MPEAKPIPADSRGAWPGVLLSALSAPADIETLRRALTHIHGASGATTVHLLLSDEGLPDWSFCEATIACARSLPPPEAARAFIYPLRAGEECLGELRLYYPEGNVPPNGSEDAAHLLSGMLRAALAEGCRAHRQAQEELQQILVHDLRSPLATLRGYLELLAEELPAAGDAREYLAAMRRAAAQQEELLGQLLALYEINRGRLRVCSLRIRPLLEATFAEKRDAAALASLRLEAQLDISARLRLVTEEQPLRRALSNLLENAIRYTPPGGTVRFCAAREGERLLLRIRDDGPGVPVSVRERMFAPFERAPVAGVAAGTGLGLAYTNAAVERLGGGLWLESTGEGSEFALWLPLG